MSSKVLLTSGKLSKEFKTFIDRAYPELECLHANDATETSALLPKADYVAGFNFLEGHKIDHLEWIHSFGAGVDSFMKLPIPTGCTLSKTTGRMGQRMGEYCLAFVMEDLKQLGAIHQNQQNKGWETPAQKNLFNTDVVILGTGYVGSEIAKVFHSLAHSVIGINTSGKDADIFDQTMSWEVFCTSAVKEGTIIINTLPLTSETKGLINRDFFKHLRDCIFINVGRGASVNEDDLLKAIENKQIRKAILDVFSQEPLPVASTLWNHPQCIITPHLAGPTSLEDIAESFAIAYKSIKNNQDCHLFIEKDRQY